jgi:hypothetical protein
VVELRDMIDTVKLDTIYTHTHTHTYILWLEWNRNIPVGILMEFMEQTERNEIYFGLFYVLN